jgi:putative transposase
MTLWKTYYHLIWATHDRLPLITTTHESELYQYIRQQCSNLDCPLHAIGGTEDHIHLVVSIPPRLAIAKVVKQIKGSSSHYMNQTICKQGFAWQNEYGVFSLGSKQLEIAVNYVLHQKQHHAKGTTFRTLEPSALISQPVESILKE